MDISEEAAGAVAIVSAKGRLDGETSPALGECLQKLASASEPRLLIDLSKVSYISSAGLRVVMAALKTVQTRNGVLAAVCAIKSPVYEALDLTGFTSHLRVFPERGLALKHLNLV